MRRIICRSYNLTQIVSFGRCIYVKYNKNVLQLVICFFTAMYLCNTSDKIFSFQRFRILKLKLHKVIYSFCFVGNCFKLNEQMYFILCTGKLVNIRTMNNECSFSPYSWEVFNYTWNVKPTFRCIYTYKANKIIVPLLVFPID